MKSSQTLENEDSLFQFQSPVVKTQRKYITNSTDIIARVNIYSMQSYESQTHQINYPKLVKRPRKKITS